MKGHTLEKEVEQHLLLIILIGGKYNLPIIEQFIHSTFSFVSSDPQKYKDMIEKVNISQVMNQYQIVTDADYVCVEKGNSQGKINKGDLLNAMFQKGTPVKDYNLNTEIGIYYINVSVNGTINGPSNSISYGILFVLKGLNNYIVQIACSVTGLLNVFIRTRTELAWSEWKSVNIT